MATVIPLSTLADLAVQGPEGKANFTLLHSLLKVVLQQLEVSNVKVEFRGEDSTTLQGLLISSKEENRSHLEYKVLPQDDGETLTDTVDTLDDKPSVRSELDKKSKGSEIIYVVEGGRLIDSEQRKPQIVSYSSFTRLEGKVKVLQAQLEMLGTQALPNDEQIIVETRSSVEAKPISDLIHSMNIVKRMSGAEEGLDKLASLLETVAKEYADLKLLIDKIQDELGQDVVETMKEIKLAADYARKMRPRADLYEKALKREASFMKGQGTGDEVSKKDSYEDVTHDMGSKTSEVMELSHMSRSVASANDKIASPLESAQQSVYEEELGSGEGSIHSKHSIFDEVIDLVPDTGVESEKLNNLICQHEFLRRNVEYITAQVNTLADFAEQILPEILSGLPHMEELKKKIAEIRARTGSDHSLTESEWAERRGKLTLEERVSDLEGRLASHSSKLRRQDTLFCDKYDRVINSVKALEEFNGIIKQKLHINEGEETLVSEDLMDPENFKILYSKVESVLTETTDLYNQMGDLHVAQKKIDQVLEQVFNEIESLQSAKADRFEMDDILADKADCSEVQMKVSQDLFEEFCNGLTKGVDFAIKNTEDQEKLWRRELGKLCKLLQTKFNISEVQPLKDEMFDKMGELEKKIEEVATMKAYAMTAGSKRRLYSEVNCISCDKKAVMDTEEDRVAQKGMAVRPYINVRPYIAYELDQLRNLQLKNIGAKNVIIQEQVMKNYAKAAGFDLSPEDEVRFVNRYCGGSHTLLNPMQRVAKVGKINENM